MLLSHGVEDRGKTARHRMRLLAGHVLEMFGIAAGKSVEVKQVQSIKRGDPVCGFEIRV
jgi:hypothetical protein